MKMIKNKSIFFAEKISKSILFADFHELMQQKSCFLYKLYFSEKNQ
jgi:hypothetical protein